MLNKHVIIRSATNLIIPFITLFIFYIQINGEISPGGGFQAGAIFATLVIATEHIIGKEKFEFYIKNDYFLKVAALGVALYALTGLYCLIVGYNFLDYYALHKNAAIAQTLGIFIVELGVGICVSNTLILLYFEFLNL